MKISEVIDLSWRYGAETRLAPGSVPMQIRKSGCTANGDAMELTSVEHFCVHYGTHLDCPAHMIQGGFHIEDRPVGFFVGLGLVVDCSGYAPGTRIGPEILEGVCLDGVDFLLLYTGWAKKFGTDAQYGSYPLLSEALAQQLGAHPTLRGIGMELNNYDVIGDTSFPIHRLLLGQNSKILLEALRNLDRLLGKRFLLVAAPLVFENAEGGPCRALALVEAD